MGSEAVISRSSPRVLTLPLRDGRGPGLGANAIDHDYYDKAHTAQRHRHTRSPQKSRELFIDALGLPLEASPGSDYFHSERIEGSKHFGVWPLSQAAQGASAHRTGRRRAPSHR